MWIANPKIQYEASITAHQLVGLAGSISDDPNDFPKNSEMRATVLTVDGRLQVFDEDFRCVREYRPTSGVIRLSLHYCGDSPAPFADTYPYLVKMHLHYQSMFGKVKVKPVLGVQVDALQASQLAHLMPEGVARAQLQDLARVEAPPPRLVRNDSETEEMATEWIKYFGWSSARQTGPGSDGGIDVLGDSPDLGTVVAQVKFEAKPTGRPALQGLFGAGHGVGATHFIFFSSAGYTPQSSEWADAQDIALFQFTRDGSIEPQNAVAHDYFYLRHLPHPG